MNGTLTAVLYAVEAGDAAAMVDAVLFGIDAGCLTVAGAFAASVTFFGVDDRLKNGELRQPTQYSSYWADVVAPGSTRSPRQDAQTDKGDDRHYDGYCIRRVDIYMVE